MTKDGRTDERDRDYERCRLFNLARMREVCSPIFHIFESSSRSRPESGCARDSFPSRRNLVTSGSRIISDRNQRLIKGGQGEH
jgi:hypothetical protein